MASGSAETPVNVYVRAGASTVWRYVMVRARRADVEDVDVAPAIDVPSGPAAKTVTRGRMDGGGG
jgi:hypothetical protein